MKLTLHVFDAPAADVAALAVAGGNPDGPAAASTVELAIRNPTATVANLRAAAAIRLKRDLGSMELRLLPAAGGGAVKDDSQALAAVPLTDGAALAVLPVLQQSARKKPPAASAKKTSRDDDAESQPTAKQGPRAEAANGAPAGSTTSETAAAAVTPSSSAPVTVAEVAARIAEARAELVAEMEGDWEDGSSLNSEMLLALDGGLASEDDEEGFDLEEDSGDDDDAGDIPLSDGEAQELAQQLFEQYGVRRARLGDDEGADGPEAHDPSGFHAEHEDEAFDATALSERAQLAEMLFSLPEVESVRGRFLTDPNSVLEEISTSNPDLFSLIARHHGFFANLVYGDGELVPADELLGSSSSGDEEAASANEGGSAKSSDEADAEASGSENQREEGGSAVAESIRRRARRIQRLQDEAETGGRPALTERDSACLESLVALGFTRKQAEDAYYECGRNPDRAAANLFEKFPPV